VSAGGNGRLINVVMSVISTSGSNVTFRTDRWAFTRQTSAVTGRVWNDANGDGVVGGTEPGINGVHVDLFDTALGLVVATMTTAGDGNYSFNALLGGRYEVRVIANTLPVGAVPTFDPDGVASPNRFALDLACDQIAASRHFGYSLASSDVPAFRTTAVLRQNIPNPFNPSTWIEFELPAADFAEVVVCDVAGRAVKLLTRATTLAGPHRVEWDGRDESGVPVASGVYYYSLHTAQGRWMKRMVLLR